MTTDRTDQPIIISEQPATQEMATLLALRNRQRLRGRELRERTVAEAVRRAGVG